MLNQVLQFENPRALGLVSTSLAKTLHDREVKLRRQCKVSKPVLKQCLTQKQCLSFCLAKMCKAFLEALFHLVRIAAPGEMKVGDFVMLFKVSRIDFQYGKQMKKGWVGGHIYSGEQTHGYEIDNLSEIHSDLKEHFEQKQESLADSIDTFCRFVGVVDQHFQGNPPRIPCRVTFRGVRLPSPPDEGRPLTLQDWKHASVVLLPHTADSIDLPSLEHVFASFASVEFDVPLALPIFRASALKSRIYKTEQRQKKRGLERAPEVEKRWNLFMTSISPKMSDDERREFASYVPEWIEYGYIDSEDTLRQVSRWLLQGSSAAVVNDLSPGLEEAATELRDFIKQERQAFGRPTPMRFMRSLTSRRKS